MEQKLMKILIALLALIITFISIFFYSIYYTVDHPIISTKTVVNKHIPKSLSDKNIIFFSDIKYNLYMDEARLTKMIDKINATDPDIVIFGGDLFADYENHTPKEKDIKALTKLLKSIHAPLGKFAVLGDQDEVNDDIKKTCSSILFNSDFEVITNQKIQLRNNEKESITLIGLDSLINGTPNYQTPFDNLTNDSFTILVSHCPDIITKNQINTQYIDIFLSGHSLGGQVCLPIIGPIQHIEGAKSYTHGTYNINNTLLYVTNGLGTINADLRLFCRPEIVVLHLQNK